MIKVIEPVFRDEKATELNKSIESLLGDLEAENEAIIDIIMDMTIDSTERKDKSFWEVIGNAENYQELITLKERNNTLEYIISELKSIVYSDYKEIPVTLDKKQSEKKSYMNRDAMRLWLGTCVKPLILEGITSQKIIGEKTDTPANTISQRVTKGFGNSWNEYVELVKQGIY